MPRKPKPLRVKLRRRPARTVACQFVGDENTVNGRIIPCTGKSVVRLRLRGIDAILIGKKFVCQKHMTLLLSREVKDAGRDWMIDRWLNEYGDRKR